MTTKKEFLNDFSQVFDCKIEKNTDVSGEVYYTLGQLNCLFYILYRKADNYQNWGVRKKIIDSLQRQSKEWFLVLLSDKTLPSYFLTKRDVIQSIGSKWKLNTKGDYKTTKASLKNYCEFNTVEEFRKQVNKAAQKKDLKAEQEEDFEKKVAEARTLTQEVRLSKINEYPKIPISSEKNAVTFNRNPYVKAEILERANGICGYCKQNAPFILPNGTPFLEVHHIVFLKDGGEDTIDNAIALCPNCHKGAHYGGYEIKKNNDNLK